MVRVRVRVRGRGRGRAREVGTPSITPGQGLYTSDDQLRAVEALKTWVG